MPYKHKIDWSDPSKGSDAFSFTIIPFKVAVLDFHAEIEGQLEDIINLHFCNPDAFKTNRLDFSRRVPLVKALIGQTPDDEIWSIVNKLNDLRNEFAHGTPIGSQAIRNHLDKILELLEGIWPTISLASVPDEEKDLQILIQAHMVIRRFFREIKRGPGATKGRGRPGSAGWRRTLVSSAASGFQPGDLAVQLGKLVLQRDDFVFGGRPEANTRKHR